MSYTVVWKSAAVTQLAQVWVDSENRHEVTNAVDSLERLLRADPLGHGESRAADTRIAIFRPIVIRYSVSEADRLVEVLAIHEVPASRR